MTERWRKPILPIAIETDTQWADHVSGVAMPYERVELVLHDDDVRRLAQGYGCMNCLEPLEHAFPERCPVCNYPVRDRQTLEFAQNYNGYEPKQASLVEKLEALDEQEAKEKHVKSDGIILVPKDLRS